MAQQHELDLETGLITTNHPLTTRHLEVLAKIQAIYARQWFTARQLAQKVGLEDGYRVSWVLRALQRHGLVDVSYYTRSKIRYRLRE
jgi:predicted transcriptional regulator